MACRAFSLNPLFDGHTLLPANSTVIGLATARPVDWSGDEEVRENNKGAKLTSNRGIVFIHACREWVWEGLCHLLTSQGVYGTRSAIYLVSSLASFQKHPIYLSTDHLMPCCIGSEKNPWHRNH